MEWARTTARLSVAVAAKKVSVSPDTIEAWESGDKKPTINQLRKAARVYRRGFSVFFLPKPPEGFDTIRDFRRVPTAAKGKGFSYELQIAIRAVQEQRESALELAKLLGEKTKSPLYGMAKEASPEALGAVIREVLGVTMDEQRLWRSDYSPLNNWIQRLELAGVLVVGFPGVEISEARGFSLSHPKLPVVAFNTKDAPRGRLFTLLHEAVHVARGDGGACDLGDRKVEAYCNAAAAECLIPERDLAAQPIVLGHRLTADWDEANLTRLANRYGASKEAVLRRLVTIGKATERQYGELRALFAERAAAEAQARKDEGKPVIVPYARKVLSRLGARYVRLVFEALHEGRIGIGEASTRLGAKVKHFEKLDEASLKKLVAAT